MASNDDFKYDPEAEDNVKKYRLPFALCKANGIKTEDWWTPREAWKALNREGLVDDVSEEYKEYYRKLKRERNKKYQERAKFKRQQLNNPLHNPDKNYQHQDGFIAGVQKGKPMTHEQADSGNVNPFFGKGIGYGHNCQTCVATYLARRQGYDVRALPNLNNKYVWALSHSTEIAYIDKKTNTTPKHISKPRGESVDKFLNKQIQEGEIFSVEFNHGNSNKGHIITATKKNGNVTLYDPQTNQTTETKNIGRYFRTKSRIEIMNLSNCVVNEQFADNIMKKK